jgi:hypothetical protein
MADLYTKIQDDPGFIKDKIETGNDFEYLLTQIEMILFTQKTEVLGSHGFGSDLETLIFETNLSASTIENVIIEQIRAYCDLANTYNVQAVCQFYKGVDRDLAVLDISIDGRTIIGMTFA